MQKGLKNSTVEEQIVNFFRAYDEANNYKTDRLTAKLDSLKVKNKKLKNEQACDFSEQAELENLFLDCVDESKKEVLRRIGDT